MKSIIFVMKYLFFACAVLVAGCGPLQSSEPSPSETVADLPKPPPLVSELWQHIGTPDELDGLPRYLRFDFLLSFNENEFIFSENLWDRETDRYRTRFRAIYLEGSFDGLVDMKSGTTSVFKDGQALDDPDMVREASYRAFNDTYWLVSPFKLADPGTNLAPMPETPGAFHLTFGDGVGQTPRDQFWVYLDPETGMWDYWAYFLESMEGEPSRDQAAVWKWEDWEDFGGVKLARTRTMMASPQFAQFETGRIDIPVLKFLDSVDDAVFSDVTTSFP